MRERSKIPRAARPPLFKLAKYFDGLFFENNISKGGFTYVYMNSTSNAGLVDFSTRVVSISIPLHTNLEGEIDSTRVKSTLLHELIHVYIYIHLKKKAKIAEEHGSTFKDILRRINQKGKRHGLTTDIEYNVEPVIFAKNKPYRYLCTVCKFEVQLTRNLNIDTNVIKIGKHKNCSNPKWERLYGP